MTEGNPISIHGDGITLAKEAVQGASGHWPVPEGTILAPLWKRVSAFMLDTIVVMGTLYLITSILGGQAGSIVQAYNVGLLLDGGRSTALIFVNWFLIFGATYFYHKYLVSNLGRSLGQRWFGLAVVREDGEPLQRIDCGRRAISKLRYMIPLLNLIFAFIDAKHIHRRHTHQSGIDLACASIVVIANSLPPSKRLHLR